MDYMISDTHFGHSRIIEFERNQFSNIQQHDNFIMKMIEDQCLSIDDTLYHLGDVGSPSDDIKERWSKLKCKKILIRGNHDKSISKFADMFDEIYSTPIYYNRRVVLSHEPIPVTSGTLNVHGHLHNAVMDLPNYLNISIHQHNYKLLNSKACINLVSQLPKDNLKFGHEWFYKYYKFTDGRDQSKL